MSSLEPHFSYLTAELAAARAAPMSAKRALLVALLIDAYVDRLFGASGEDDLLAWRARRAAESPELGLVMDVAAGRAELVVEAVAVPIEDYPRLSEAEFMVSLYNGRTVPRVLIAQGEARRDVHEVLRAAVGSLAAD